MLRLTFFTLLVLLAALAGADTLVTEAKILQVTERGFVLKIGTEPLAVEDTPESRLWKSYAAAERAAFKGDEAVGVRIKTDTDPPVLREMADLPTWRWLAQVRKDPMKATILKVEAKTMSVKLVDGKDFEFRISEKTDIELGGKKAGVSDLAKGASVYVKGRLLPTLDTWLVKVSDRPIEGPPAPKPRKEKPLPALPATGRIEGVVQGHLPDLKMFDLDAKGRTLHVTYPAGLTFWLDGKANKASALAKGQSCVVHYTRDKTGRILASKVELFSPTGGG